MVGPALIGVIAAGRDRILDATRALGSRTTPTDSAGWSPEGLAEHPSSFGLVGVNRRNASGQPVSRFSTDGGASWTASASTFPDARSLGDVVFAGWPFNQFWACQNQGTGTRQAAYSSDGDTWAWENITPNQLMNGICWAPPTEGEGTSLLVAVGPSGHIARKAHGGSWAAASSVPGSSNLWRVAYAPEIRMFVTVGEGGVIWSSPDGDTWTSRTSGTATSLYGVAWSPKLKMFAAVGGSTEVVTTSPDGVNWTVRTTPGGSLIPFRIMWVPELSQFVTAGPGSGLTSTNSNSQHLVSSDGVTWSRWSTSGLTRVWRSLCWSKGSQRVIAGAYDGTPWVGTNRISYWDTTAL